MKNAYICKLLDATYENNTLDHISPVAVNVDDGDG